MHRLRYKPAFQIKFINALDRANEKATELQQQRLRGVFITERAPSLRQVAASFGVSPNILSRWNRDRCSTTYLSILRRAAGLASEPQVDGVSSSSSGTDDGGEPDLADEDSEDEDAGDAGAVVACSLEDAIPGVWIASALIVRRRYVRCP
jgi:hypothetical protein